MSSTNETGHAKNVDHFGQLINACTAFGVAYNPVHTNISITALQTLYAAAQAEMQASLTAKTTYNEVANTRQVVFKDLKKLATRVVSALSVLAPKEETVENAKTVLRKMQGRRAPGKKSPPDLVPPDEDKTISVSQQSFSSLVEHFGKLIEIVSLQPQYTPNETTLSVGSLQTLLDDMKNAHNAVSMAGTDYYNARIQRNKTLYNPDTGLVAVAADVKQYVKSLFGVGSPEYKAVSKIKFRPVKV